MKSLRLLSTQVKICQIPYTNFEATSQFLSNFCSPIHFHGRLFISTFLAQTIYTLLKRSPLKWNVFYTFECSGHILSNSFCQFWNDESIPFQIFFASLVSWRITPLYFFRSNNINFAHKEPIKVRIFETLEGSV